MSEPKKTDKINFENSLKTLDEIVGSMENGDLSLETLIKKYEEGTKIISSCRTTLEQAELSIEKFSGSLPSQNQPRDAGENTKTI